MQKSTLPLGGLDPRLESSQLKVVSHLSEVMRECLNFDKSECGPSVHEAVMESIYLGLGGENSLVANYLQERGIDGGWEQRWVLLTWLMAGHLEA